MRILVTGGAGFVGSSLALALKQHDAAWSLVAFDNLRRRGSELCLKRLAAGGVEFTHGDVRCAEDLAEHGRLDVIIDCSAEPSVHAGSRGNSRYVVNVNLMGTLNCLELARANGAAMIFMSSSRVYSIPALRALPLVEGEAGFQLPPTASGQGCSGQGIGEEFSLLGPRSLYGATKLSAELLVEEYRALYGIPTVVNRCSLLSGPWQMGRVDQGGVALWAANHLFSGELTYTGFGGAGHQVRDVLHIEDLCDLVICQLSDISRHDGRIYNVGGGPERAISLRQLSAACARRAGRELKIKGVSETSAVDVPWYVSDTTLIQECCDWSPKRSLDQTLNDIFAWLTEHRDVLPAILLPKG